MSIIKLKNVFSKTELDRLVLQTNKHALTRRKLLDTNLDYLDTIKNEQNISLSDIFKLPNTYTKNEQILLMLNLYIFLLLQMMRLEQLIYIILLILHK